MAKSASPLPSDHPLFLAWEEYRKTEDYVQTRAWAERREHLTGSLWAVFVAGWEAKEQHDRGHQR